MANRYPTCPECGDDHVQLDSLCRWAGDDGWVYDCDDGDCYCGRCSASFREDDIKWVVTDD